MIFPEIGPQYFSEKNRPLLSRMESFYAQSITLNQSFWGEADIDTRFEIGDQTLYSDLYGNLPANRRRNFNFNRIRRVINMISGYQRRNRKSIIYSPVENASSLTADQFTQISLWHNQKENVLETISSAFHGALVTGMNLLHVWMDYREDPINGNIKVDNSSYNSFLIDPFFRKPDLSDCQGIWKRTFLTKRECISLLPDHAEEILGLIANSDSGTGRDGKFQFMPESYGYSYKNLLTYDEFYYRDYRSQKMLVDTQTGETMEWRSQDEETLKLFLRTYPSVTVIEQDIPTVKLGIVVQGKVFYEGANPSGTDLYPFVPVMAYYNPQSPYWPQRVQGVVRGLRDAQYLYNRRRIIELDILESQITSGFKYKESSLINPSDIYLQGQGRGIALKEEAQMTDVEQIQAPQVPPSMIQLSELLAREVMEISGVNEELLGSAVDDKAGILSMLRQGAGLTTLQVLFDQLDLSQRLLGKLILELVQINFTPGKVKRILNGKEPSPEFYNKNFGKYEVVVEEGMNTATQKQMQFAQLIELKKMGMPIPDDILLDSATFQRKDELIEAVTKANQQAQQMQQAQMEAQTEEIRARIKLTEARAMADEGLGMERVSRIQENQALAVERRAAAQKDQDIGLLNLIKALKEIDTVDIDQLQKLLSLSAVIEARNQAAQQSEQQSQQIPQPQPQTTQVQAPGLGS